MAENMAANILGPVGEEIGKNIVATVRRQFNYLCCFKKNIESMRDEAKDLEDERLELKGKVDAASRGGEVIAPKVNTWLTATGEIQVKIKDEIEGMIPNAENGCLNITTRYSLSKKAKEATETMEKHRKKVSGFHTIANPAPEIPPAALPFSLRTRLTLESRNEMEDKIVEDFRPTLALKSRKQMGDDIELLGQQKLNIVGIAGMGGLGKTTMAENIMTRLMAAKLVEEAVKVVVSQPINLLKIQDEIANSLALENLPKELEARARQLLNRLTNTKNVVILLDDIWEKIELADLGIPREGGCITIFTSRYKDLLNQMDAKVYSMETLSTGESWSLFKYSAGTCVDDRLSIAEEVVRECKGWPIAIVTVGKALKDKPEQIWNSVLHKLKLSRPIHIEEAIKDVYNPLRQSYELLGNQDAQSLFLLCSLFPEDHDIGLEDLVLYSMGLKMFKGVQTLEQARYRVWEEVEKLKGCFLLLDVDGSNGNEVKMHDVIRDVAIFIASEKGLIDGQNGKWSSVFQSSRYDESYDRFVESNFQSLSLLIIKGEWHWGSRISEGMQKLNVLSLTDMTFETLPELVKSGKTLQTLELNNCNLVSLSPVVELSNLVILKCYRCWGIEELPVEIGRLKFLKLLDLSDCGNLGRIPAGVISKLVELEELKMLNSFKAWESSKVAEGNRKNVAITELESLCKLKCLEIEIDDIHLVEEEMLHFPKALKYKIFVGFAWITRREVEGKDERVMVLRRLRGETSFGNWIREIVNTTQRLYLYGDGSRNLDLSQAHSTIRKLKIEQCRMLNELVNTSNTSIDWGELGVFPMLEHLKLANLSDFNQVCGGQIPDGSVSFRKLRTLKLQNLPSLTQLWKSTPNEHAFLQLETLEIVGCEAMEQVFISNKNDEHGKISCMTFPKLRQLELRRLPSLTAFWKGPEIIEFPSLENLKIWETKQFKSLVVPSVHNCAKGSFHDDEDDISGHLLCGHKVKLGGLKSLTLGDCNVSNIWCRQIPLLFFRTLESLEICNFSMLQCPSLFSSSIAENLVRLSFLRIANCNIMEELLRKEEIEDEGKTNPITFPNLSTLEMVGLPNLKSLGKGIESIEFPVLGRLMIRYCPKFMGIIYDSTTESNEREGHGDGRSYHDYHYKCLHLFCPKLKKRIDSPIGMGSKNTEGDGQCNHEDELHPLFCHKKVTFGELEILSISGLDSVSMLCCHQFPLYLFTTLKGLTIDGCHKITSLFSPSMVQKLVNLNSLHIYNCNNMEQILRKENSEGKGNTSHITFPKLEILNLCRLSSLTTLGKGIQSMEFPMLWSLEIQSCPKLRSFASLMEYNQESEGWNRDHESCSLLLDEKIKLGGLCDITIYDCDNIRSLFSSSMIENLSSLRDLKITNCKHMEKVIACKELTHENSIRFPSLYKLQLIKLPSLGVFCEGRCALELPSLGYTEFIDCPRLEFLNLGSISTPKLHKIDLDKEIFSMIQLEDMEDLNSVLRQHLMSATENSRHL